MALWICEKCRYGLEAKIRPSACPACGRSDVILKVEGEKPKNSKKEAVYA